MTGPRWSIRLLRGTWNDVRRLCWCQCWTPRWHEGRGAYISIGLGIIAVYRGY